VKRSEKGLRQTLSRVGVKSNKSPIVIRRSANIKQPAICDRCGAVYDNKTWRNDRRAAAASLDKATWVTCPACKQVEGNVYFGRVLASGSTVEAQRDAIERRVANIARLASARQPERKLLSAEWDGKQLEILTTSQKLAHRIAKELAKSFGGKPSYKWSDDDGSLLATWKCPARE